LIGYKELFEWIRQGEQNDELEAVVAAITTSTLQYAKRQKTFLKKFIDHLKEHRFSSDYMCEIVTIDSTDNKNIATIIDLYKMAA
ncbi:MAG: hypothetical protein V1855_03515, partial [bacterium]